MKLRVAGTLRKRLNENAELFEAWPDYMKRASGCRMAAIPQCHTGHRPMGDRGDGRPQCWNREPATPAPCSPRPWFFEGCTSWDNPISPSQSVPGREGWDCRGCRWLPEQAREVLS